MSLNLPNSLAFFRILLAPLMFFMLVNAPGIFTQIHISWINYFAALIFVIASVTDFLTATSLGAGIKRPSLALSLTH